MTLTHRGSAEKQVLVGIKCSITEPTLDTIETAVSSEGLLRPRGETSDRLQVLLHFKRLRLLCGNVHFLITLLGLAERALRQLTTLVGHVVASFVKHQLFKVKHLTRTKLERGVRTGKGKWNHKLH